MKKKLRIIIAVIAIILAMQSCIVYDDFYDGGYRYGYQYNYHPVYYTRGTLIYW